MPEHPAFATFTTHAAALTSGASSSHDIVAAYLDRIARIDGRLGAYAAVFADRALQQAAESDRRRAAGEVRGPLDGVPFAAKDNFDVAGLPGAVGSKMWGGRLGTATAAAIERLEAAGMVLLGKTNMVEFAWGAWGTNPLCGTPWNPWDLAVHRVPGGSSSGSAVAVAAGLAPAAIGSDTGGSIRIPSALNGLVGLKPTFGRVSLYGCYPLSTTLDTAGPIAHTVADVRLLLELLAGYDARDPGTYAAPAAAPAGPSARGRRLALLPESQFPAPVEPSVRAAWLEATQTFRELGAQVEERAFPFDLQELVVRNGQIIAAESYAIHREYIEDEAVPIGPAVRARTLAGKSLSAADYIAARDHQRRSMAAFVEWMDGFDALLTPSTVTTAIPVAEVDEQTTPALFTRTANYLGACAITLPAGFSPVGLPIGVQLIARPWAEFTLLTLAEAFEAARGGFHHHPDLTPLGA